MFLSFMFFFPLFLSSSNIFASLPSRQRRKGSADKDLAPSLPRLSSSLLGKLSGTKERGRPSFLDPTISGHLGTCVKDPANPEPRQKGA